MTLVYHQGFGQRQWSRKSVNRLNCPVPCMTHRIFGYRVTGWQHTFCQLWKVNCWNPDSPWLIMEAKLSPSSTFLEKLWIWGLQNQHYFVNVWYFEEVFNWPQWYFPLFSNNKSLFVKKKSGLVNYNIKTKKKILFGKIDGYKFLVVSLTQIY